jgi:hypothetical protein
MLNEPNKDQIPEKFPRERNNIDDFIKRRPSLNRSITGGGSGSTFRGNEMLWILFVNLFTMKFLQLLVLR